MTSAAALSRYSDIIVAVYEAPQSFREISADIGIWPAHNESRQSSLLEGIQGTDLETNTYTCARHDYSELFLPLYLNVYYGCR
jgi:hypothetical protein